MIIQATLRDDVVRYFFDTEFIEDGETIDLVSIGIVCSDGREYYAANADAKLYLASEWVRANVLPHLPSYGDKQWRPRERIAQDVRRFVGETHPDPVEFWAYYADYDWVTLCQLFGTMMDLPMVFPMFCMDLKQLSVLVGSPKHPPDPKDEHNALADARWNRDLFAFLTGDAAKVRP